jgi:hypothetical protein
MKYAALLFVCLFTACSSSGNHQYTRSRQESAAPEWQNGERLNLTGTLWPSRANAKFYIETVDGKSANLKGSLLDHLKPGTKISLSGRVEYENSFGTAGASEVVHNQTVFYVNVLDYRIITDTGWDVKVQNAADPDEPDFSLR